MRIQLNICKDYTAFDNTIILINEKTDLKKIGLTSAVLTHAAKYFAEKGNNLFQQQLEAKTLSVIKIDTSKAEYFGLEQARKAGNTLNKYLNGLKVKEASFYNATDSDKLTTAFAEGLVLSNYEFLKYKSKEARGKSLAKLNIDQRNADKNALDAMSKTAEAVFFSRTLINEPLSYLTATQLSKDIAAAGKKYGFKVDIYNKKKIESLKMGGLLAVNRGSIDPPTFTILEYKSPKAKNKKPVVLVGKGVVYDTGGLSLKPTPNSMDQMKSDMSGAAAVAGIFIAAAQQKLPVHIVGLIPATDNRPGMNAYVPGDVVKMMSGLNVEMLNADAEGRMILADALHFAKKYNPELVFDFATLTGAAVRAIGSLATACMGTADEAVMKKIDASANNTYERLIHFPLWDEYGDWIKSELADINNVGPGEAGHITAGKFLQHFTSYPWVHFDIAPTAFVMKEDSYRGKYGTGIMVRMVTDFLKNY
jgi:leucyl aminopeptidase